MTANGAKGETLSQMEQVFGADIYKASFDNFTLKEINQWVAEHTDDMIPEIWNEIPSDAVMYLINALAFDAEWQSPYKSYEVSDGIYTTENEIEKSV